MRLPVAIAAVVAIQVAVCACLAGEKAASVSYATYGSKVRSLDPATCGDTMSAVIQGNIFEGLYGYHYLKRPVQLVPLLAAEMPDVSKDGLTYTIKIRKDVKYAPNACFGADDAGKPKTRNVKAGDFVLAFKRIADTHIVTAMSLAFIEDKVTGIGEYRGNTRGYAKGDFARYTDLEIAGIKALDDYTLQIKLDVPFPQLVYVLAIHNYAPIPHEVVDTYLSKPPMKERVPTIYRSDAAVGTGPYMVEKFDPNGGRITLVRNPEFRKETYPAEGEDSDKAAGLLADAGKTIPFVDVQNLDYMPDDEPAWANFLVGKSDTSGIPATVWKDVIDEKGQLRPKYADKLNLMTYRSPAVYWLAFNMKDPALGASKSLRQALCLSFDVEKYIADTYNGRGVRAVNVWPSGIDGWKEAGPGAYWKLDIKAAKEKIAAARKELIAAGVMAEGDELPILALDLGGRDDDSRRMGEFVRKQFLAIGVQIKIELNDWPTLQKKVEAGKTQMYTMGWHADYPDAQNFLQLFYSKNIELGTNNSNYSSKEFDALYEKAAVMADAAERTKVNAKMAQVLAEDCPVLMLSEPVSYVLSYKWVNNVKPHPFAYGTMRYERIDADLRAKLGPVQAATKPGDGDNP